MKRRKKEGERERGGGSQVISLDIMVAHTCLVGSKHNLGSMLSRSGEPCKV